MKELKDNIKTFTILGLIVYILFLQQCKTCPESSGLEYRDSLVTYIDTVNIYSTDIKVVPKYITLVNTDTIIQYRDTSIINTFSNKIEDSLISGFITSRVDGTLVSQHLIYTPKFPKYIIRRDSIFIKPTIPKDRIKIIAGAKIGGNKNNFDIGPLVGIRTKKDFVYLYNYDILANQHNIMLAKQGLFRK